MVYFPKLFALIKFIGTMAILNSAGITTSDSRCHDLEGHYEIQHNYEPKRISSEMMNHAEW